MWVEGGVAGTQTWSKQRWNPELGSKLWPARGGESQEAGGGFWKCLVASAAGATSLYYLPRLCAGRLVLGGGRKQGGPLQAGVAWRVSTRIGLFIRRLCGGNVLVGVASHPEGQGWLMGGQPFTSHV